VDDPDKNKTADADGGAGDDGEGDDQWNIAKFVC
jgi:hypothetical protein